MTFAEFILALGVVGIIYFLMNPLRRRLETYIYNMFKSKDRRKEKPVIDITDFVKKDKKKK